ncbi:hypothetical protein AKJ45_01455 [candidate division MSBL1 archaeon SCGC-AAA261F19]|uniref:NrpR transcriptional repressor n=1 Tax=candidate division MSBL1 archaeon SCGC-AAA261F19 TaxID=1698275 RepID=A0A133VAP2_9EURY|nr:hypothetical protein AKJ45_01455 [candidate division MSBL1 archaeon SCGC-AAA261F19]
MSFTSLRIVCGVKSTRSKEKVERLIFEILSILQENKYDGPMGARTIARELEKRGFEIGERAVRYHLKHLDERGLTEKPESLKGRIITEKGEGEVRKDLVGKRIGFVIGKIEELIYKMSYNLQEGGGTIAANISLLEEGKVDEALNIMKEVMEKGYAPSPLVKVSQEGESMGRFKVPKDKVGIATVCSITIDGILEGEGIPVSPKFGGVLEFRGGKPKRFTDAITYQGSSLDPLDVFASKKMASCLNVTKTGSGSILANLREVPISARPAALDIINQAEEKMLNGVLEVGHPAEPLFGLPVDVNRVGIAVVGGINPAVAVDESGIQIETSPMETLLDISEIHHIKDFV